MRICTRHHPATPAARAGTALLRMRRGFTLLEALMASGILLGVVVAVTSAITAGQQNALEAQQRIAGALAAEELLGRIVAEDYASLPTWNGYSEPAGTMSDQAGTPLTGSFVFVGRDVQVTLGLRTIADLGVRIQGRTVTVRAFTSDGRTLALLTRFVPAPA